MKRTNFYVLLLALALFFTHHTASAVVIDITPVEQTVTLGDSVSVDIFISGLTDSNALGDFDFDLFFDSSILGLTSVSFGNQLGDSLQDSSSGSGWANLNELSWESALDLVANQANSFSLATLTFNTLSIGTSEFFFDTIWALGDQNGDWLGGDFNKGLVNVIDSTTPIPEPSSLLLLALGLLGVSLQRRARR